MTHDDALLDQIGVLALGALPAAEASQLRAHIVVCAHCRNEYAALRATADLVGYAAETPPLDELSERRMKSRVMHAIRASAASDAPAPVPAPAGTPPTPLPSPFPARPPWLAYGIAAAALIAALLLGASDVALRSQIANESARTDVLERQLGDLYAGDSEHFPIGGGEVIRRGERLYLAMHSLPKLAQGRVFQVWTLKKGERAVAPSVTFTPDSSGGALVTLPVPATETAAVAISQEPPGGSSAPTTTPAFVRKLP